MTIDPRPTSRRVADKLLLKAQELIDRDRRELAEKCVAEAERLAEQERSKTTKDTRRLVIKP